MNLENSIKNVITQKLEDGTVERLVAEQLEKGVNSALESMFRSYGDATKVIEDKIKSVMVPYLEAYDYSEYVLKLDDVLTDILRSTALDNKKMLENFKDLMTAEDRKSITVSELFDIWKEHVSKEIDTSELEVVYDDGVSYEYAEVTLEVEHDDNRSWSSFKHAKLIFECEKDEEMNLEIRLSKYENGREKGWDIDYKGNGNIHSLRRLSELEILLMRLSQAGTQVEIDTEYERDEVEVEAEPEASFD